MGDRARTLPSVVARGSRHEYSGVGRGQKCELDGIDEAVLRTADRKIDDVHAVADRLIDRRHAVRRRASGDRVIRKTPACLVNGQARRGRHAAYAAEFHATRFGIDQIVADRDARGVHTVAVRGARREELVGEE